MECFLDHVSHKGSTVTRAGQPNSHTPVLQRRKEKRKKTEILLTRFKRGHGHFLSILESSMNALHSQLLWQGLAQNNRTTWKSQM